MAVGEARSVQASTVLHQLGKISPSGRLVNVGRYANVITFAPFQKHMTTDQLKDVKARVAALRRYL
jgi:hypothetical protein